MLTPRGFTLIELLVSVSIFALLVAISFPVIGTLLETSAEEPVTQIESLLHTAARHARNGASGTPWGLYLPYDNGTRVTDEVVLFSGASYAARDATKDVSFNFDDQVLFTSVQLSGSAPSTGDDHEIVFDIFSGATGNYGSITFSSQQQTYNISISAPGIAVTSYP